MNKYGVNDYEPPLIGKVVIVGSFFAVPVIAYGTGAVISDDANALAIAASLLILIIALTVFMGMMALLKTSLKQRLPDSPEARVGTIKPSAEGVEFNAPSVTLDEYLRVLTAPPLSDEEFMAAVDRFFPELRIENA